MYINIENKTKPGMPYNEHEASIAAPAGISGEWLLTEISTKGLEHLSDEKLQELVISEYRKNKNLRTSRRLQTKIVHRKNLVMNLCLQTIAKRLAGVPGAGDDLITRYIAFGTNNLAPAPGQAQLALEKPGTRVTFIDQFVDGNKAVLVAFYGRATGNCNESTVLSDPGNSTTQFRVQVGESALFNIGDSIRVQTTVFDTVTITNIDPFTDTITVGTALSAIPAAGAQVIQVWQEGATFGNQGATASTNTGTMFNRVNNVNYVKTNAGVILAQVQFSLSSI